MTAPAAGAIKDERAWVRRVLEEGVRAANSSGPDPLVRLSALGAPTADIDRMLSEIEAGRG